MPIEGPLRELGIHDVFQLLDLSRKTGMLRVTSQLRDDEGVVYFDRGRVVHASIRSKPWTVDASAMTQRELERKVRHQIEATAECELCLHGLEADARVLHVIEDEFGASPAADRRVAGREELERHRAESTAAGRETRLQWVWTQRISP